MRRTDQRLAAVFICYQQDVTGAPLEELVERAPIPDSEAAVNAPSRASDFTVELVKGVQDKVEELDGLIEDTAIDWHVERIAPLERSIMRVALYEIVHRDDVPDEVAIDEAVETAKLYCGPQAPGFVNGILGGILEKVKHG